MQEVQNPLITHANESNSRRSPSPSPQYKYIYVENKKGQNESNIYHTKIEIRKLQQLEEAKKTTIKDMLLASRMDEKICESVDISHRVGHYGN